MQGQEENPDVPKGFSSLITGTVIPLVLFLAFLWVAAKFLIPTVDYKETTEVKTAPLASFREGVHSDWRKEDHFFIVKEGHVLFALSATDKYAEKIIHQTALLNWIPDRNQFVEPSWGSFYDRHGNPAGGPATLALDRLALRLNEMGEVIVDPGNVQNMDGEVRRVKDQYRVEESLREVEPFFLKTP
jgi:hypothetical protein